MSATSPLSTQLKLLSVLLQYPDDGLARLEQDIAALLGELPPSPYAAAVASLAEYWQSHGLVALQQEYVRAFDFQKRVSLHLTYYRYGDLRQRGPALLRLKRAYAAAGLPLREGEMPDYLPVLLEFCALAPVGYGERLLREQRAAIELLRLGLRPDSPYCRLLEALCAIAPPLTGEDRAAVAARLADGPPTEDVGLEPFAPPEVMPITGGRRA